jgi:hypothetical protein
MGKKVIVRQMQTTGRGAEAAPATVVPPRTPPRKKRLRHRESGRLVRQRTLYLEADLSRSVDIHCAEEETQFSATTAELWARHLADEGRLCRRDSPPGACALDDAGVS